MGVMYKYFAAGSDERAAAAIDLPGGPSGGVPPAPELLVAVRAGDREAIKELMAPQVRWSEHGLQVLEAKGIDPEVQLGTLEEMLTGASFEEVIARPRAGAEIAVRDGGECMVLSLTDELQQALAGWPPDQFESLATAWVRTEEFGPHDDAGVLEDLLRELAQLARDALDRGERLYCWVSL